MEPSKFESLEKAVGISLKNADNDINTTEREKVAEYWRGYVDGLLEGGMLTDMEHDELVLQILHAT